ncbi:hypothetical protein HDV00_004313 [Rhizophlyctis rosea]|nr:hypothetical protein HDV00_004313 [Rhizophlyctis rosea]
MSSGNNSLNASRKVILVTGANGGVGFGTAQCILQHALETNEDITLILACRNKTRAEQAKSKLMVEFFSHDLAEGNNDIQILLVDLSSSKSVLNASREFRQRFKRLDSLVLNAGILPLSHISYWEGLKETLTSPAHLARTGGMKVMIQYRGQVNAEGMGETFAANVFGHYILVKELVDSLAASGNGRIIWFSSTTADPEFFDEEDYQCLKGPHPYESSKRACELVCMAMQEELRKRNIYSFVCSPGNCNTGMVGDTWVMATILFVVLWIMRLAGLSGINMTGRNGATSSTYLTTVSDPQGLDPRKIYHSEISRFGKTSVALLPMVQDDEMAGRLLKKVDALYQSVKASAA